MGLGIRDIPSAKTEDLEPMYSLPASTKIFLLTSVMIGQHLHSATRTMISMMV
jgi:hypothetical protein